MFEFFYKRTHLLFATIAGLFIFGILGLIFMPKNLFPDSARPEIVVFTSMPGASANVIATSVSKPIEEEVAKLSHIYDIRSTNVPNFSIVHIIFDYTKTLNDSMLDVSNALNKIKSKLPPHTTSAIYLVGTFTQPVDLFSVSSDKMSLSEVRKIVDSFIKPKLLTNKEIGNVEIFGGYESAISITIDAKKLKKYNKKYKEELKALPLPKLLYPNGNIFQMCISSLKGIYLLHFYNSFFTKLYNFRFPFYKEILKFFIISIASAIDESGKTFTGSIIIPLSLFLTFSTSFA